MIDVLIFDMDGVLVDVSESYRDAVRLTVQTYLQDVLRVAPARGDWVSREDVAALKMAGGFNNDWDLTVALVRYFLARRDALNVASFARSVQAQGGGLDAVRVILGDQPVDADRVKRIFEEIYLGNTLFAEEYGQPARLAHGAGLIGRERLIPNPQSLVSLSNRLPLGIATGRPRHQAEYALERFGIRDLFKSLVTLEDIQAAEENEFEQTGQRIRLGKPHPFALEEAVRRITTQPARAAYVGDTPDDIRAAKRARDFLAIGCVAMAEDKQALRRELERVGAHLIVDHLTELLDVIK